MLGLFGTVVAAINATPKAIKLIENAEEEKGDKLTKLEVVKTVWKPYVPMAAICFGTAVCIVGSNILSKRQQASLVSGYALVSGAFSEYKNKVKELYGKEAHDRIISAIAAEKSHASPITANTCFSDTCLDFGDNEEEMLFYDDWSRRYFTSTLSKVLQAEYHLNRNYVLRGCVELNEFYDFLGISRLDSGDEVGWTCEEEISWIDFDHQRTTTDDGLEVHIIQMVFAPYEIYSDDVLSRFSDKYYLARIDDNITKLRNMSEDILAHLPQT